MPVDINASIIDQRIRTLANEHRDALARGDRKVAHDEQQVRSRAFVALTAQVLLDRPIDDVLELLTDGSHDLAIDALDIDDIIDGEFVVTLFQGKYRQKLDGEGAFPANEVGKMIRTVSVLFDPDRPLHVHPELEARIEEIRSLVRDGHIPRIRVVLCNNGKRWREDADALIAAARFPSDQVTWEHVNHDRLVSLMGSQKAVDDHLRLAGEAVIEDFNYRRVLVGKVPVSEIKRLFEAHGEKLLERNIRRYLGVGSSRVNREIAETLRDPGKRSSFYFFNNGITVTCSKFRHNALQGGNYDVRIDDLQVINGGQTCVTIQSTLGELPDQDFSQTYVLLRLYELESADDDVVRDITYATNSQNPVDLRDLRANDDVQKRLELGLADLGYVYRRKQNGSRGPRVITPAMAAEAVFAIWRGKPHLARFHRREMFGRFYEEIFTPDLSPAQVVLAVEIFRRVEAERRSPSRWDLVVESPPRFLPYASHLLAMLVGRHLLSQESMALDAVSHERLGPLLERLGASFGALYDDAVLEVRVLLALLPVYEHEASLQRLSATFRRADLLAILADLPDAVRRELERHAKEAPSTGLADDIKFIMQLGEAASNREEVHDSIMQLLRQGRLRFLDYVSRNSGLPARRSKGE